MGLKYKMNIMTGSMELVQTNEVSTVTSPTSPSSDGFVPIVLPDGSTQVDPSQPLNPIFLARRS
jgi:hypothetical protein